MVKQQMSESLPLGFLLMLAGGFLDAYSYLCRGEVFANAQTGNIVLLGISLAQCQWEKALQYVIPIAVFAFGILIAEKLRNSCREKTNLHWRQVILLLEIGILILTVFLGIAWNWLANSMISFVCALQVESFRKIRGNAYASTMCTGNLRSAAEAMYRYEHTGDVGQRNKSFMYYLLVAAFMVGALLGAIFSSWLHYWAVLVDLVPLALCFMIMFREEDNMEFLFQKKTQKINKL